MKNFLIVSQDYKTGIYKQFKNNKDAIMYVENYLDLSKNWSIKEIKLNYDN